MVKGRFAPRRGHPLLEADVNYELVKHNGTTSIIL